MDAGNNDRAQMISEIKASDPENIMVMTSNLSLNAGTCMDPEETPILREFYKREFHPKHNQTETQDTISSLASLCDNVVIAQLMCPECKIVMTDKRKHTILTGCRIFPFYIVKS